MGLFSRKKEPAPKSPAKILSNGLNHLASRLKLVLKPKSIAEEPIVSNSLVPENLNTSTRNKRVSTIIDDEQHADFEGDDFENDDNESSDYESEDDDYEEHTHVMLPRAPATVSQLSALMGLCGLGMHTSKETLYKVANEELKRTFSLLSSSLKINRLSPTMNKSDPHLFDSVIGDKQINLINELTKQLNQIMDLLLDLNAQYQLVSSHKTLHDRYGNVKDVIGRGAYGVIKIIDPKVSDGLFNKDKIYAVKEIQIKPGTELRVKETREKFIERVISEFILSSTLNSKHIVRTLDFLLTLPSKTGSSSAQASFENSIKISQVMECTSGRDFFSYIKQAVSLGQYICIDEMDCMIKQLTKGLWYMHNHGVAHCDLKLENILITYDNDLPKQEFPRGRINLKISDFGKSNVVRTKWDSEEQLQPSSNGPIGSEPYMAPEEFVPSKKGYSLLKKDCWALGILILVLYNVRRSFFVGKHGDLCHLDYYDEKRHEEVTKSYSSSYLWRTTEVKLSAFSNVKKYKDEVFDEYEKNTMLANYDKNTKEWTIQRPGSFLPIETLFDMQLKDKYDETFLRDTDFEEDDFTLRKYFIYKLLDINPKSRATADMLLKSDWLRSVECCCE